MATEKLTDKRLVEMLVLWEQDRWESAQRNPRPCTPLCMGCSAREAGRVPSAQPALGLMGTGPFALPINAASGLCAHCERVAGLRPKDDFEYWELAFFRSDLRRKDQGTFIRKAVAAQRRKQAAQAAA